LKPRRAQAEIEASLPAASHSGGCGRWCGGGSTTTWSKRKKRPWWEKGTCEARELVVAVTFAHSQIEPAAREQVQGRNLLRKQHRVVPWQHENRRAEAKARRARRDKGQEGESGRDLADAGKVMLGHEARMETERFGFDVGFDEIEEALGARRHVGQPRCCGTAEQSKSHGET
jgi:hypothetical protein